MSYLIDVGWRVVLIGVGATMLMDIWLIVLKRLNIPTLNFALVGRWVMHIFQGQWFHQSIAKAPSMKGELLLGWCVHYAVGVVFAVLFTSMYGYAWLVNPTVIPAIVFGIITVAVPFLVMQPAMGSGIAASKAATPWVNRQRSCVNHAVFGAGLYVAALLMTRL